MCIDCHEAPANPKYSAADTLTDVYDVGLNAPGTLNSSLVNSKDNIQGQAKYTDYKGFDIATSVLTNVEKTGLRGYYYTTASCIPTVGAAYGVINGAYFFILEIPGITGGDNYFARRVFAQVTTIKELMAYAKSSNGALAKEVVDARNTLGEKTQVYDVNSPIVIDHDFTRSSANALTWNNPLVAADATKRDASNPMTFHVYDVANRYRSLPTAYVIPADAANVSKVLSVLKKQDIAYYKLASGTTLKLSQYGGTVDSATLGSAKSVTFANGAYIIPVDGYKAYLTALLFEPDNTDAGTVILSFAQAGKLELTDLYRSTESYIAAKLGLGGTYTEIDLPAGSTGKTVSKAAIDGVSSSSVGSENGKAYIVAPDSSQYTVKFSFTDGTEGTVRVGYSAGDVNSDGTVTLTDALILLKSVLNSEVTDCDMNSDGTVNLIDVVRVLKLLSE